jgi:7-cyano-7-deazaguanine synthase
VSDIRYHAPADREKVCVLSSGGVDSAVLLRLMALEYPDVYPAYVRCGLAWEEVEISWLRRYIDALAEPRIRPLSVLELPTRDLYQNHWSVTGAGVPDADSPDEAVYLPGRNLLLYAKAAVFAALNGIGDIASGQLAGNPFPDATPAFFAAMAKAAGTAVGMDLRIVTPLLKWKKHEVIREGWNLPLEYSFSCMNPVGGMHCGNCNKCFERKTAFAAAGVPDKTTYAGEV